jgi:alkaline phosphatase D
MRMFSTPPSALAAPSFARAGFIALGAPFSAPLVISAAAGGDVLLSTALTIERSIESVPVHWEIAREPAFRNPERYGLLLACGADGYRVRVALDGLERGRSYWARLWAGGTWSRAVRVRTGPRANGSSALSLTLARRLHRKAS